MIVAYIDAYKASFGVEPTCRVLKDHDYKIAPTTYYAFKRRPPSARWQSDQRQLVEIRQVYHANYACYGVRKVWQTRRHQGLAVGRDQVAPDEGRWLARQDAPGARAHHLRGPGR